MQRKFSALVIGISAVGASALFSIWTLANPPSGTPGTTSGAISASSTGATTADVTINGTTTIVKSLNMSGNKILNVATPATSTDAANMGYTIAPGKLWGQGRPGVMVLNASGVIVAGTAAGAGECTVNSIKVARGSVAVSWDNAAAGCPANWWVCSAAERGAATCGSQQQMTEYTCSIGGSSVDAGGFGTPVGFLYRNGWVADTGVPTSTATGMMITTNTTSGSWNTCNYFNVWCCKS